MERFSKLFQLLLQGGMAYATPSKVDDIAAGVAIVNAGYELLKKAHERKLEKRKAHLDAALEHNKSASELFFEAEKAKDLLGKLEPALNDN